MCRSLPLFLIAGLLSAEPGLNPRPKPEEFPTHQETANLALGAEFMVHSFGRDSETYVNEDYLTFEVGVYPAKGKPVEISAGQFTLRVNGKKDVIHPERASMVSMSLKYSDWEQRTQRDGAQGSGFPGDNRRPQGRLPAPPQVPTDSSVTPPEHIAPSVLLKEVALVEGEHKFPAGGYLYFPYRGKIKSIKSLELIYTSGPDSITLRLR